MDIATTVNELPRIWTGDLEHERLGDFLVSAVKISYDRPVPYQVGGEARGLRTELIVRLDPDQVPVLSFA
jgi:diacylglycerol kinase family enzyme